MPAARKPKPPIEPGRVDGVDMSGTITGPPSEYAQASLEAECWRIGPGAGR